jgi:ribosomal protein S18 acetylase RimI-like enzyme
VPDAARVRRARESDLAALAPLLYLPAAEVLDRMFGSRERATRVIAADLRAHGVGSMWVAEIDGEVAGAMVAYRYGDAAESARGFLRTALRTTPPWRWPPIVRLHWLGERHAPVHPADWLFLAALAVDPAFRRRGVALTLLTHAEHVAEGAGAPAIVLDTAETNAPALALYERCGYTATGRRPGAPGGPASIALVKRGRFVRDAGA